MRPGRATLRPDNALFVRPAFLAGRGATAKCTRRRRLLDRGAGIAAVLGVFVFSFAGCYEIISKRVGGVDRRVVEFGSDDCTFRLYVEEGGVGLVYF